MGEPTFDDDFYDAKLAVVLDERPAVASFAFGCPTVDSGRADLHGAGIEVWVTVTDRDEAELAANAGADAVVAQGAGGRGPRVVPR